MSKKTQFTRSKAKIGSLSWTSPIYPHGEGKYQDKILHDNIPGYPGYQRSYIPRLINLGFTRKEISEIMNLGVQLVSDYYNKYKEVYG